jgi:hypothetical protein
MSRFLRLLPAVALIVGGLPSRSQAADTASSPAESLDAPAAPATPAQKSEPAAKPSPPPSPAVIPAIAPVRVLPIDPAKQEGLIPDIKMGSGAKLKFYGYFKTSVIYDSSSPYGNDFPLPFFLAGGDAGPDGAPEFHVKARNFRIGANFEWPDKSDTLTLTGRVEGDFEGDFTRVANRNVSSIRSSQFGLRLAWARLDRKLNDKATFFALFGQDWTPFGSSTLPPLIEVTGLGVGFGSLYERAPQARFGLNIKASDSVSIGPEVAVVLPAYGNLPTDVANQLAYGERQGADSERPEIQGRLVFQFPIDSAPGVVPAQIIGSFVNGKRRAIVRAADVPAAFKSAFPTGATVDSDRNGWTAEIQLPTRALTLSGKYYDGKDLRFYFAGQLFSNFNDTTGLTGTAAGPSLDGSSSVVFGLRNGSPTVAPQTPIRAKGGMACVGFPLSRIFGATPGSRSAGWTLNLGYGYDEANAADVLRAGASNRQKSNVIYGNLNWKLNSFLTFAFEQSRYETQAIANPNATLPIFKGVPTSKADDNRSEFAAIVTF